MYSNNSAPLIPGLQTQSQLLFDWMVHRCSGVMWGKLELFVRIVILVSPGPC